MAQTSDTKIWQLVGGSENGKSVSLPHGVSVYRVQHFNRPPPSPREPAHSAPSEPRALCGSYECNSAADERAGVLRWQGWA